MPGGHLRFNDAEKTLDIGVSELLDRGPRRGGLTLSVGWSSRRRLAAGMQAHQRWQSLQTEERSTFAKEVTLRHRLVVRGWLVQISGRVDGLSREGEHLIVEELKSTTWDEVGLAKLGLDDFPMWKRQVQLYLHMVQAQGEQAFGRLVLVSLVDGSLRSFGVSPEPGLDTWLSEHLDSLIFDREDWLAWNRTRRTGPLPFPHEAARPGQNELVTRLENGLTAGQILMLEAPTGTGKTAVGLSAALRVAAERGLRVFFATARGTGQKLAEETAGRMMARGMPLRALTLKSRERMCINGTMSCRPEACRFAAAHHEHVRDQDVIGRLWRDHAGPQGPVRAEALRSVGEQAVVCPFGLALDLIERADLVIGDLNFALEPGVTLSAIQENPSEWLLVLDEAHNLPDRAMAWGSPSLPLRLVQSAQQLLQDEPPSPYRELLDDLALFLQAGIARIPEGESLQAADFDIALSQEEVFDLGARFETLALDRATSWANGVGQRGTEVDPWLEVARQVLRLRHAIERAGAETVALWRNGRRSPAQPSTEEVGEAGLSLFCRDPARVLGPALGSFAGVALLSATLRPFSYYRDLCGLDPERLVTIEGYSPFPPENRKVLVFPQVSTRMRHRERDRVQTLALINRCLSAIPGNVALFAPSFQFLDDLLPGLDCGGRELLVQLRGMEDAARAAILDRLSTGSGQVLAGVLGGLFSEGVDLPGTRLQGVIILGPAPPPVSPERRLLEEWLHNKYGEGARYAYLIPGMTRVVQAAGRVIRGPEDRGVVALICQRFLLRDHQALFPSSWRVQRALDPGRDLFGFFSVEDPWDRLFGDPEAPDPRPSPTPEASG